MSIPLGTTVSHVDRSRGIAGRSPQPVLREHAVRSIPVALRASSSDTRAEPAAEPDSMRATLVVLALLQASCATGSVTPAAYSRCEVSAPEWTLLEAPPPRAAELLALAGDAKQADAMVYWFGDGPDRLLLCRASKVRVSLPPGYTSGCAARRWVFQRAGDGSVSIDYSLTACPG